MSVKFDQQRRQIITSMPIGLMVFKSLFGGVWLFVGGMGVFSLLTGGEMTVNGRPGTPEDVWLLGIFAVIGFAIFTFRYQRCIDLVANSVANKWGFVFLTFGSNKHLAPIKAVEIAKECRQTKNGSYSVYVAKLVLEGKDGLNVDENRDKQATRRIAEDVAKFCELPLRDASEGNIIERQADALDQRLIDAEYPPTRRPSLPTGIERLEDGTLGAVLKLPSPPITGQLLVTVMPLLMVVGFWWFVWYDPERGGSDKSSLFFSLFNFAPLLMFAIPAGSWLMKFTSRSSIVRVQNGEMSVGRRKMPISELEELTVTRKGMHASSDQMTLRFGQGCDKTQLDGLRDYLLYELHMNR